MTYEPKRTIYLPTGDFLDFELHLMETRPGVKPEAFLTELMLRWLTADKERLALRKNGRAMRGFQWKNIFLPDGTSLRTSYCGNVEFAKVVGDHIVSDDGTSLTPSLFANRHAKGRNAWRFVWLRFPGDDYWIRAADCRVRFENLHLQRSNNNAEMSNVV
ncbi:hypothetical protein GJ700_00760 [Duganella sp. FT92W]|uniref:Uncharacterized protein n=1 Tax=Pseudoduganella rivuli TaxID=2666085 RepID=A0A7X2IHR4_9BURK|nr:hypothetical protein [Pseudoduganella rivuli]MRV70251.1 hypothetical protein [Pseudoduganella rivuli]